MGFFYEKCDFCNYSSDIKCNLKRHLISKHSDENMRIDEVKKIAPKCEKNGQKYGQNEKNHPKYAKNWPKNEKIIPALQKCQKCYKTYKTKISLLEHEKNCNGFDNSTCDICMITFPSMKSLCKHKLLNLCTYRSVFNLEGHENKKVVNNFGSERIDYITQADIINFMTSGSNTIPFYLKRKYFDRSFPENNNIQYSKSNKCMVLEEGIWIHKNLNILTIDLIDTAIKELISYYNKNKEELSLIIKNNDIFENIKNKLYMIHNGIDKKTYKIIFIKTKDLIKNSVRTEKVVMCDE